MMAGDRQGLPYLPAGADVYHLTYDQLVQWGQRIHDATGRNRIGLPAQLGGPKGGLIYRFLEGYAYPSFTRSTLTDFRSPAAVQMWGTLRRLWSVTDPSSRGDTSMQDPLKRGDVW